MSEFITTLLSEQEIEIFDEICNRTPELLIDKAATCLSVCLDLQEALDKRVVRYIGKFGHVHKHAWLEFLHTDEFIIDPYPVACLGGPILVAKGNNLVIKTPWNDLYKRNTVTSASRNKSPT